MSELVRVTFQAQEWNNDISVLAEREPNRTTYNIPYEDAVTDDETLPDDDSLESDELAEHPNAPDWVQEWVEQSQGPFYIQTETISE